MVDERDISRMPVDREAVTMITGGTIRQIDDGHSERTDPYTSHG